MTTIAGERRIVTVLFADVVGSTAIGTRLGAERFSFLMDEVMRVMSGEVERFEGTVVQFVGDELYAVFGAPLSHEDDSERAVRAALAIQRSLDRYASDVQEAYGIELEVRIAINTGPVVIRPESDDPYNALGDTVNIASRIQKLVSGGEIAVGRETKSQVETCFALETMGLQELRGVGEPVEVFRVVGPLESAPPHSAYPLVGRDFELSLLERAIEGLAEGRGTIVSIMGEAGIGKSRLLDEVRQRYRGRVRFIEGRAVSYAQTLPYWPIRDLLREWLELGVATPEARMRLELKAELGRLFGDEAETVYPFLAGLLGITLEPDAAARLREQSRESQQHQTFDLFSELVCRLADEGSLCLVLEDLHWADDPTLELLEELLAVTEEAALGLVILYRSEREHGSWRLGERARHRHPHRYREIELRPLPDDASRALAASIAGAELPASVADLLAVRAGGNPFFLQEAIHDLVERGSLVRENGRLSLAVGLDELAIPTLVQGALQARLDRLEPDTREVLGIAAVVGRSFGLPLLERIVPHEQLIASLSELQRLDLVVEQRRRPAPEYSFRHGLVQEVAYTNLVEGKRRKLHRKVGEALEQLSPDSREEYGLLARHFAEADVPEKAAEYLLRAGDAARALYADQEALAHYARARDFLGQLGDERRARDTLFKMALAHHLAFDFEKAEETYDEAFCCRVPPSERLERTERIETAMEDRLHRLFPGDAYTTEGATLLEHLFRGLLAVDPELNVLPAMADNFRVSADGLTYLFRLREEMRWSDGVPVTAEDFVLAWELLRDGTSHAAFLMDDVQVVKALDDRTIEVRLVEPRSYFPYILASAWAHPVPRHKYEELGADWRRPENLVCNGPFVLAEHAPDEALLVANPHWAGPHGNVREVHVTIGPSTDELLEAWRGGRFDVLQVFDTRFAECPDTNAEVVPGLGTHYIGFSAGKAPFSNELVRKAFGHALDRTRILGPTALNRPVVRGGATPPAMPGHSPRIALEYDPDLARRLLEEAGYPQGRGLGELVFFVPSWLEHPERLTEQWAEIGAQVVPRRASLEDICGRLPDADLWLNGWTVDFPDPDGFFRGFMRELGDFYRDDEIEELVVTARSIRDQDERMRLYHRLDRLLVAERAAILPVLYSRALLVRRPWVDAVWANPMSGAHLDAAVVGPRSQ
jgi:ABC-type transport system substrate-binding protein/class 3 adenylate cyclase